MTRAFKSINARMVRDTDKDRVIDSRDELVEKNQNAKEIVLTPGVQYIIRSGANNGGFFLEVPSN